MVGNDYGIEVHQGRSDALNGLALKNQGDIDRQFLAGAISTGTHGTGRKRQNLSAAVTGLFIVLQSQHCLFRAGFLLVQVLRMMFLEVRVQMNILQKIVKKLHFFQISTIMFLICRLFIISYVNYSLSNHY